MIKRTLFYIAKSQSSDKRLIWMLLRPSLDTVDVVWTSSGFSIQIWCLLGVMQSLRLTRQISLLWGPKCRIPKYTYYAKRRALYARLISQFSWKGGWNKTSICWRMLKKFWQDRKKHEFFLPICVKEIIFPPNLEGVHFFRVVNL